MKKNTRREFLVKGAVATGVAVAASTGTAVFQTPAAFARELRTDGAGKLVAVECSKAMKSLNKENAAIVGRMTNQALKHFSGKRTVVKAWRDFIHPSDTVGIKLNCLASPNLGTSPAMVHAIVRGLQALGIPNERIILYEQYKDQLVRRGSGFALNDDPGKGPIVMHLGEKSHLTDGGLIGYEKTASKHHSGPSHYSNMLKHCSALINVPVIKDHSLAGVTVAMKNMTHGNINNPHHYHKHDCNPQIADIYDHPLIKDKVRLTVCDGLRVLYDGGPQDNNRFKVLHNRIYVTTDAVALDSWGFEIIEELRKKHGKPSLHERHPTGSYLARAEKLGLGVADRKKIELKVHQLS
ncbi:MAG TPA: DUF362 domain-containing protein [Myxococcales bacterium]|nr:DUF362 domain-containing protein [Myxococcales bacterium]